MSTITEIFDDAKQEKDLYFELGRTLIKQDKFRKAIEFLTEAKQIGAAESEGWKLFYLLGDAYKNLGKYNEAVKNYIEAAIRTDQYKTQCYELAKGLIASSSPGDMYKWLQGISKPASLTEEDIRELTDLTLYSSPTAEQTRNTRPIDISSMDISKNSIADAYSYIGSNQYKNALAKIEEALSKDPTNYEILFLKIRILVEGQIDTNAAVSLFDDKDFGYREAVPYNDIINDLKQILEKNSEKGNAYYFAAFIGNLMSYDLPVIKEWVKQAEYLGINNDNSYPLLGLYILKAEIAVKENNNEEAASNFYEAAKSYYWLGNNIEANKYFKKTIVFNKSIDEAYKYSADVLYLLSFLNDPPYNDEKRIKEALNTWNEPGKKNVTDKNNAWFYIVFARICEVNYKFRTENYYEEFWKSVLYAERALIHDNKSISFWTYLGRYYRCLELECNGLNAIGKAIELGADDETAKEERVILLINKGEYDEPMVYLDELKKKQKEEPDIYKAYHKSWEGYIIFHQEDKLAEALRLFDEAIKEDNTEIFAHQMKMICHWYAHQSVEAKKEAEEIIALGSKYVYLREDFTFSWAHFILGRIDQAINMLETAASKAGPGEDFAFSLSQFYLYSGQFNNAEKMFKAYVGRSYNKRILTELSTSLSTLEFHFNNEKQEEHVSAKDFNDILSRWKKIATDKTSAANTAEVTPKEEFNYVLGGWDVNEGSIAFITIQVALARLSRQEKNFEESYAIYTNLLKYSIDFPEAAIALEQIRDEVIALVRSIMKEGEFDEAIRLLGCFEERTPEIAVKKNALLSLSYYGIREEKKSLENLQSALSIAGNDKELEKQIWSEIVLQNHDPILTWSYGLFLEKSITGPASAGIRRLLNDLVENNWNSLIGKQADLYPIVTPIAVDISIDLVPADAESPDWYVIKKLVPAMRDRVDQKYAVKPAPVRIRENEGDLEKGTYVISLDEVPLILGTVQKGKLFITKTDKDLSSLNISGENGWNPIDGKDSIWVDKAQQELLDKNNISYWEDHFDYIIAHLESFLENYLEMFVDTQFCDDYLSGYAESNNEIGKMAALIREDSSLLLIFKQLLAGLLREKISIANKAVIIGTFMKTKNTGSDINDIIQYTRIELKDELFFNKEQIRHILLPGEIEDTIKKDLRTREGKSFLEMLPNVCQDVLTSVREIIVKDPSPRSLILVTTDPKLRIHVKKLLDLEYPNLMIASKEELNEKYIIA